VVHSVEKRPPRMRVCAGTCNSYPELDSYPRMCPRRFPLHKPTDKVKEDAMMSYAIKPDDSSKLKILSEIGAKCAIEGNVAKFTTGAAFLTALTYLRRKGVRCEVMTLPA